MCLSRVWNSSSWRTSTTRCTPSRRLSQIWFIAIFGAMERTKGSILVSSHLYLWPRGLLRCRVRQLRNYATTRHLFGFPPAVLKSEKKGTHFFLIHFQSFAPLHTRLATCTASHAYRMLIGACNLVLCPMYGGPSGRTATTGERGSSRWSRPNGRTIRSSQLQHYRG